MTAKTITKMIPTVMAIGLVNQNLKKKKKKSLVKQASDNIIGVSLIQATSQAGDW